jgi:hypothetical protein
MKNVIPLKCLVPKLEQLWLLADDDAESKWTREQAWFILGDLPKRAVSEWEYVEDEFRIELFCKRALEEETEEELSDFINGISFLGNFNNI